MEKAVHKRNFEQWSIVSKSYHNVRPTPPHAVIKIILSWLGKSPDVVVDVGCGTGLSTTIWQNIAASIIGIEPNDEMRAIAEKSTGQGSVVFKGGVSNNTSLPADYTDIVTVSQAFHWMDIDSSLAEFYRILKPGGILAIYDFALPPVVGWELEKAFLELRAKSTEVWYSQATPPVHNDKNSYADRIKSFGKFKFSREAVCHSAEQWPAQKMMDFLVHISNAEFAAKIDDGIKKDVDGFLEHMAGFNDNAEVIFPYKMVIAVK
ncbi:MAG: class I SAM-dependent methyltransferase [Defluviitaleaceae bacterium]|nr:class I SAM-dependent methyltransferase [Defluviitaleaceae bacterium]